MSLNRVALTDVANAMACEKFLAEGSGYFSGGFMPAEETGVLSSRNSRSGQVCTLKAHLPRVLMMGAQLPSGCVVVTGSHAMVALTGHSFHTSATLLLYAAALEPIYGLEVPESVEMDVVDGGDDSAVESLGVLLPIVISSERLASSHGEMLKFIQEVFDLHTTDLADLIDVTRQAIHGWKSEGSSGPSPNNIKKLIALHKAALAWKESTPATMPRWLLRVPIKGRSLKEWISLDADGAADLADLMKQVATEQGARQPAVKNTAASSTVHREPTAFEDFVDEISSWSKVGPSKKRKARGE